MGRWHERTSGFLHMIHSSIITAPPNSIPNIEFILDLDDDPQRPINIAHGPNSNKTTVWGLTRLAHQRHIWLLPDYAYWAWPSARIASHSQVRRNVHDVNTAYPWEKKYNKAVWRGDANLNTDVRKKLISTAKDTAWEDVRVCDIYDAETKQYCMAQAQFCRYKYPVHTEGYTYSGRLKYLQLCNSAPVVHKLQYLEHHHGLMRSSGPDQNFIEVEKDWSDLDEKVKKTSHKLMGTLILTVTLPADDILHHTRTRRPENSRQQLQNFPRTIPHNSSHNLLLASPIHRMGERTRLQTRIVHNKWSWRQSTSRYTFRGLCFECLTSHAGRLISRIVASTHTHFTLYVRTLFHISYDSTHILFIYYISLGIHLYMINETYHNTYCWY
jgi:hypothetical protein